jgi:hypothetical protein
MYIVVVLRSGSFCAPSTWVILCPRTTQSKAPKVTPDTFKKGLVVGQFGGGTAYTNPTIQAEP